MVNPDRIQLLNTCPDVNGSYVLYWVQGCVRIPYNDALSFAVEQAHEKNLPLLVYFGVSDDYPEASYRHYHFLLEGVIELCEKLRERNIRMVIAHTSPEAGAVTLAEKAALVVTDKAYVRHERLWRSSVASRINVPFYEVESNLVVPVEKASGKEEYSAFTLRKKIEPMIGYYASEWKDTGYHGEYYEEALPLDDIYAESADEILSGTKIDRSVPAVPGKKGGYEAARRQLSYFIENHLEGYSTFSNDPSLDYASGLSPYLHYGFISPVEIYREVRSAGTPSVPDFLEQLIVRRHLAFNFVYYNALYDSYEGLPEWARKTLNNHIDDRREFLYTFEELEAGQTHDVYWNAAQRELRETGSMHNYMRMYWGKKILEWSADPSAAFSSALKLNNRYQLDGRDPNGFAGVAWCFGKHDRPWKEREVFGMVRYMNERGLKRKFDMDRYLKRVDEKCSSTVDLYGTEGY